MKTLLLAAVAALCVPLMAQGVKVGDNAADIEVLNWVNTPATPSFSELKGDVILIKAWGIN